MFFALDGTLVDHESAACSALEYLSVRLNLPPCAQAPELKRLWDLIVERNLSGASQQSLLQIGPKCIEELSATLHVTLSHRASLKLFLEYLDVYRANCRLFDDVLDCLDSLNCRLGIILGGDPEFQIAKLNYLGIKQRFDCIVTPAAIGAQQLLAGVFADACKQANEPPHKCTFVGDNFRCHVQNASRAGLNAIWLDRSSECGGYSTYVRIQSLFELPTIVEVLGRAAVPLSVP